MAVLHNGIERLGTAETDDAGIWDFKLPETGMTVFAEYSGHQRLDVGRCEGARSRRIRFHPFD